MKQKIIIGVDEAGRGPLAGPVVASAVSFRQFSVFINSKTSAKNGTAGSCFRFSDIRISEIKDSKKMTPKKREEIYEALKVHPQIEWGIGRVSEKVLDRINVFQATKLAMERAVKNLEKKLSYYHSYSFNSTARKFLLLDGNFSIGLALPQKSIIKGDEKVFLIKLASIVAKVTRDRVMLRYAKIYPQYGFEKHKGYGTALHLEMLKKYGPCPLHRKTFGPVKRMENLTGMK